ncbi:transmembrane channel-like protein 3 [Branchiostoma lanceolatum]|uniref:transmembrane channel-like protein 3 n=1 Tax=Branchiostoma lanceolatum TaxID=7740 RepID=UPI003453CA79
MPTDDEDATEEQILINIERQKEIISSIRKQPWRMKKKIRCLRMAQDYLSRYEGKLSKKRGYQEATERIWRKVKRELANFAAFFIPWETRIKMIESYFGSVVASYFIFLRWLFWINIVLSIVTMSFVVLPEMIVGLPYGSVPRKTVPEPELDRAQHIATIWDFGGYLKHSVLFYGYYSDRRYLGKGGYQLPLAYFMVGIGSFVYSFVVILRKMADNSRQSKLSTGEDQFTFCWKVFCGWDSLIGQSEAADNKFAAITTGLREAIIEEEEKCRVEKRYVSILLRILANFMIITLLAGSGYAIQLVVERSELFEKMDPASLSWWEQNEVSMVVSIITMVFPVFFDLIGQMEKYHPRTMLRWQLARIMVLNLGNLYTLMIALFKKVNNLVGQMVLEENNLSDKSKSYISFIRIVSISQHCELFINLRVGQPGATESPPTVRIPISAVTIHVKAEEARKARTALETLQHVSMNVSLTTQHNITVAEHIQDVITDILSHKNQTDLVDVLTARAGVKEQCWETIVGQEMFKLSVFDMIATVVTALIFDFLRGLFVRFANYCWCWDLEGGIPGYGEFGVAENVLHLIYNQGMIWMGAFFSPCLPLLNVLKLIALMYFRSWAVIMCNTPHQRVFRASRSNNFYFVLLLIMLFLSMLPTGYVMVSIEPSRNCGPFSGRRRMFDIISETVKNSFPGWFTIVLSYMSTAGIIIPVIMLLVMAIYYLQSMVHAYKEANNDLRMQLEYERTEGKRKVFEMSAAGPALKKWGNKPNSQDSPAARAVTNSGNPGNSNNPGTPSHPGPIPNGRVPSGASTLPPRFHNPGPRPNFSGVPFNRSMSSKVRYIPVRQYMNPYDGMILPPPIAPPRFRRVQYTPQPGTRLMAVPTANRAMPGGGPQMRRSSTCSRQGSRPTSVLVPEGYELVQVHVDATDDGQSSQETSFVDDDFDDTRSNRSQSASRL